MKGVEFSVGRHPENDLHITDARLSGFHCRIRRSCNPETGAMEILLEDLSTNGTYKNGHKVSGSWKHFYLLVGNNDSDIDADR